MESRNGIDLIYFIERESSGSLHHIFDVVALMAIFFLFVINKVHCTPPQTIIALHRPCQIIKFNSGSLIVIRSVQVSDEILHFICCSEK